MGVESVPPARAIDTHAEFVAALHTAAASAVRSRARDVLWIDPDFTGWPLEDAAWLQSLTEWIRLPQRRLTLIGGGFDEIVRSRSRFVAWHRIWSHAVAAFTPEEGVEDVLPCVWSAGGGPTVQLLDPERWRGRIDDDSAVARVWFERADALLQRCVPALPATTLGL